MIIAPYTKKAKLAELIIECHGEGLPLPHSDDIAKAIGMSRSSIDTTIYEMRGAGALVLGPGREVQYINLVITADVPAKTIFTKTDSERAITDARKLVLKMADETGRIPGSVELAAILGRSKTWTSDLLMQMVTDKLIESPRRGVYQPKGLVGKARSLKDRFLDIVRECDDEGENLPSNADLAKVLGVPYDRPGKLIAACVAEGEISHVSGRFYRIGDVWNA